jgi:hypothetical protein
MARLGQPMFDPVGFADHVEAHLPGIAVFLFRGWSAN